MTRQTFLRQFFVHGRKNFRPDPSHSKLNQPPINANALGTAVLAGNDVILRHAIANDRNDLAADLTDFFR